MSRDASFSDLAMSIERSLEEEKTPRTFADRVLTFGESFILAIAFFALSLTANVVANAMSNTAAFIAAFVGLVVLKFWRIARDYEDARSQLKNLARDARLVAMIVDLTVEALEKRQRASATTDDRSDSVGNRREPEPA